MKTLVIIIIVLSPVMRSMGQTHDVLQLVLNYEKLKQLEEILDNMYKGYKILSKGYDRIKNVAEGNYTLHQVFLDGLFAVNPAVAKYKRIPQIIRYQALLLKEYKRSSSRFKGDPNLTQQEIQYLERVYSYLIKQSLKSIEELTMTVTAGKLRMSDDERIQSIDRIYFDIEGKLSFLKQFNSQALLLVVQRAKDRSEVETSKHLYDLE